MKRATLYRIETYQVTINVPDETTESDIINDAQHDKALDQGYVGCDFKVEWEPSK